MLASSRIVSIVDDDISVRESLAGLMRAMEYEVRQFASADAFWQAREATGCLILDVRMPGMNGTELQDQLRADGIVVPIIFVTALSDDDLRARVMERGAVAFLEKPFDENALIDAVRAAFGRA